MTISYESNFFRFWRRQWQGLTHQWQKTQRQVSSSLAFGVQSLLYSFWQFLQNQPWLTPTLKEYIHPGQHLHAISQNPPAADEPLDIILASLEFEWLPPSSVNLQPVSSPQKAPRWQLSQAFALVQKLGDRFIHWFKAPKPSPIVIQLKPSPTLAGTAQFPALKPATNPAPPAPIPTSHPPVTVATKPLALWQRLGHWVTSLMHPRYPKSPEIQRRTSQSLAVTAPDTATLAIAPPAGRVEQTNPDFNLALDTHGNAVQLPMNNPKGAIQGVACQLSDRQLVLVNHANQVLALLTPEQQRILHHRIFWQMACYYQRQRQWLRRWGRQEKLLGTSEPAQAIAPVIGLWEQLSLWLSGLRLPTPQPVVALAHPAPALTPAPLGQLTWAEAAAIAPVIRATNVFESPGREGGVTFKASQASPSSTALSLGGAEIAEIAVGQLSQGFDQDIEANHRQYEDQLIIDIEAAFMGYDLHWLEKCLLWCDRWLTRLEEFLGWVLQGIVQGMLRLLRRIR